MGVPGASLVCVRFWPLRNNGSTRRTGRNVNRFLSFPDRGERPLPCEALLFLITASTVLRFRESQAYFFSRGSRQARTVY